MTWEVGLKKSPPGDSDLQKSLRTIVIDSILSVDLHVAAGGSPNANLLRNWICASWNLPDMDMYHGWDDGIHDLGWMLESPGDLKKYWCLGPTLQDIGLLGLAWTLELLMPLCHQVIPRGSQDWDSLNQVLKASELPSLCPSHSSFPHSYASPLPTKFAQGLMWQIWGKKLLLRLCLHWA